MFGGVKGVGLGELEELRVILLVGRDDVKSDGEGVGREINVVEFFKSIGGNVIGRVSGKEISDDILFAREVTKGVVKFFK